MSQVVRTVVTFETPTGFYSPALGKEWLFLFLPVTQATRLGPLTFTIRLSTILDSWVFRRCESSLDADSVQNQKPNRLVRYRPHN